MTFLAVIDSGASHRRGTYRVAKVLAGLSLDGKGKASFSLSSRIYCYIAKVLTGLSLDGKGKASFSLSSRINDFYGRSLIRAPFPGALLKGAHRASGSKDK